VEHQRVTNGNPTVSGVPRHEKAAPDGPRSGDSVLLAPDQSYAETPERQVSEYRSGKPGSSELGADKPPREGKARRSPEKPDGRDKANGGPVSGSGDETRSSGPPGDDFMDVPPNMVAALDLAQRGLAVFPIRYRGPDDKGREKWTPITGWQESASADFKSVAAWWSEWPDARVGLLTGERNGIMALDLDTKNGKDGPAAMAALGFSDLESLSPVRVRTPSGGWHLLFRHDPRLRNSASKIGDGIDIKTTGGFIVAPGSWKGERRYEPEGLPVGSVALPTFPEKLAQAAGGSAPASPPVVDDGDDLDIWAAPNRDKIKSALAALPAEVRDDRDQWLRVGMALHHEFRGGDEGFNLWNDWSKDSPEHGRQRDQREDWASFGGDDRKPVAIATLYGMAKDHGWNAKVAAPREPSRLQLLTPADCTNAPARGYVIKGLIAPRDVACIFGAPGGGKSTIAPHLGYHVARGESVFGLRTKPGKVLYVAAEDAHGMKNRVAALRRRDGDAPDFYVVDGVTDLLEEDSPDLAALRDAVEEVRPALIFIDTLAMAFRDLEENDAQSMNQVVRIARSLTCHGAAVVLIHHGTKAEGSTPRGHSVLNGALDVALQLLPADSEQIIRGRLSKNRNGPPDLDIAFRVASEELGRDDDGDAITAAIVDELPAGTAPRRAKLPAGEIAALGILREMEKRGSVSEAEWRTACADGRSVSGAETLDARQRHVRRVVAQLSRKELIAVEGGIVRSLNQSVADMDWPEDGE